MTKYTPIYKATVKDHMHAQQSNIRSTKKEPLKKYGHYHINAQPHSQHYQKQIIIWWYILRQHSNRHVHFLFTIIIVIIQRNTRYESHLSFLSIHHWKNRHWSNISISCTIRQRQQLPPYSLWSWQKFHICQNNTKPQ